MPENNSLSKVYGLIENLFLDPSRNDTLKELISVLVEEFSRQVSSNTFNLKKIDPTSADYTASFELQDHTGARCGDVINIFKDQHLKSVNYNPETKDLEFIFILQDGSESPVNVPLDDLFVPYVQGSGILFTKQEDGSIQISLDPSVFSGYLTKEEATELYQPRGDYQPAGNYAPAASEEDPYAHRSELPKMPDLSPYLTKASAEETYQPKGNYLTQVPEEYIPVKEVGDKKVLVLPESVQIMGTVGAAIYALLSLRTYNQESGESITQVEVGTTTYHLNLNSLDRVTVDTPEGKKTLVFSEDLSNFLKIITVDEKEVVKLPQNVQLMGTVRDALYALVSLRVYNEGTDEETIQVEIGTISQHLNLNTQDNITYDTPKGKKVIANLDDLKDNLKIVEMDGKKVVTLPESVQLMGTIGEAVYALAAIQKYAQEEGADLIQVEVGTTSFHLNLNTVDNITYDTPEGKKTIATTDEIPAVDAGAVRIPVRTIADKVYTKAEIMDWFGIDDETSEDSVVELKRLFAYGPQLYIDWGILLSGRPMRYKMPIQYSAFESNNQIKLVVVGLDTSDDSVSKYTILINLDGTIIEGNSNVQVTLKTIETTE